MAAVPPPHDMEAEMGVLGSMMLNADAIQKAKSVLSPEDFFSLKHQALYKAILDVFEANGAVDLTLLRSHLRSIGKLGRGLDEQDLIEVLESVPTSFNAPYYCSIVVEKSWRRRLRAYANRLIRHAYTGTLDQLRDTVDTLATDTPVFNTNHTLDLGDTIVQAMDILDRQARGEHIGVPLGIPALDTRYAPLQPGHLALVGGTPKSGKTTLAINVLGHNTLNDLEDLNRTVCFFSAEMPGPEILIALAQWRAGVDRYELIRNDGTLPAEKYQAFEDAVRFIRRSPHIIIDDTPSISIADLVARGLDHHQLRRPDLFVVDHLQHVRCDHIEQRNLQVAHIAAECKRLARETDTPVMLLTQLSTREDGGISTRWAREPEEYCDSFSLLLRPPDIERGESPDLDNAPRTWRVKLNRYGPTFDAPLTFLRRFRTFKGYTP